MSPDSDIAAILGPTNTGKTHYAVERMLGRSSGVIGLPLRLLAREVYDKICHIKPPGQCALLTGEEKIIPKHARYYVCTVEAMPIEKRFAFLAIDEVQLMNNPERGHVFTDRVLRARGTEETLLLGAETARPLIRDLLPKIRHESRDRFSTLTFAGHKKITRLPKRSVIVAFSAGEVYAIAELIRRFRGGAAVVMGALSPRTRNAQAELYQSGEVDFLIATDAVGMGLNLDADHVAFASMRKFDGRRRRALTAMEAGQIAGRAGRFRNDGTFGTTGDSMPMDPEMINRIENHEFEPIKFAEWRNSSLSFNSLEELSHSLHEPPPSRRLRRIASAVDEDSFERLTAIPEIKARIHIPHEVKRLWDVCQIPDFRNMTTEPHVRMLQEIHTQLHENGGKLIDDYMHRQVERLNHTEGNVDILSGRLAQIRTWTYCANKTSWMRDPGNWVARTRDIEDRLSDALHQGLIDRFVDRRTSALLKGMSPDKLMNATVKDNGEVWVDDHMIGHLEGLSFKIDDSGSDLETKALNAASVKTVGPEIDRRLTSLCGGDHTIFTLSDNGKILWGGTAVGKISGGSVFTPNIEVIGAELGNENLRTLAEDRMREYLRGEVTAKLAPLFALKTLSEHADTLPAAKGFAFLLLENHGSIERSDHFKTIKDLEQDARRQLREVGVTFGQYNIFIRDMLKPKPAALLGQLIAFGAGGSKKPFIPFAGVTSIPNTGELASEHYSREALAAAGYRACGPRIIRFDILDRLAFLIRQAQNEAKSRKFQIMQEMLAILGCTYEEMQGVLRALGYKSETIEAPPETQKEPDVKPETISEDAVTPETPDDGTTAENPADAQSKTEKMDESPPPKPAKKKSKSNGPLSVYEHRETGKDGTTKVVPNLEYWHMPYRKAPNASKKPFRGKQQTGFKGKKKPQRTGPKPARGVNQEEPRRIEDSPFAALAALKGDIKDKK